MDDRLLSAVQLLERHLKGAIAALAQLVKILSEPKT